MTDNIIELNKETEQFVIQAGKERSRMNFGKVFGDKYLPLTFVHASDMHAVKDNWNRMVEYVNYYKDYLSFVLHTGDYCGGDQTVYVDLYEEGDKCERVIYQTNGNHDCFPGDYPWHLAEKESVYKLLYNHTENWDVNFMDVPHSMSYYKDFPDSNIRMIVLDDYYDTWETRTWLRGVLSEANEKGLHVFTAQHERTGYIKDNFGTKYTSLDDYRAIHKAYELSRTAYDFDHRGRVLYEDVILEFIENGGNFICNFAGHEHYDEFGITDKGVLNVVVQNGTYWDAHGDMKRVKGTKSYDCFNVVGIDTELGLLKIIRIGADVDHYMRKKTALCFDYINIKVISEI